jgi:hypothetical protein
MRRTYIRWFGRLMRSFSRTAGARYGVRTSENEALVITPADDGLRVHAVTDPKSAYFVTGSAAAPECTCPDFQNHASDPEWRCKHILAALFRTGEDPVANFARAWREVQTADLAYGARDSWERLARIGRTLLAKFLNEEARRLQRVQASERPFRLGVTTLGAPFVGVIDLVADLGGKRTVVDFKTAAAGYPEHEAALSDQLTACHLGEPDAEQAALCVLVKTNEPRVEWHVTSREPGRIVEYLAKVSLVAGAIARGEFYKRPGRWCGYCDFLPLYVGDNKKVDETLVRITPARRP